VGVKGLDTVFSILCKNLMGILNCETCRFAEMTLVTGRDKERQVRGQIVKYWYWVMCSDRRNDSTVLRMTRD
jgi:hypothetical protein